MCFALSRPQAASFVVDNIEKLEREEVRNYRQVLSLLVSPVYRGRFLPLRLLWLRR